MAIYDYSPTKVELQSLIQFFSGGRCNVTLGGERSIRLSYGDTVFAPLRRFNISIMPRFFRDVKALAAKLRAAAEKALAPHPRAGRAAWISRRRRMDFPPAPRGFLPSAPCEFTAGVHSPPAPRALPARRELGRLLLLRRRFCRSAARFRRSAARGSGRSPCPYRA